MLQFPPHDLYAAADEALKAAEAAKAAPNCEKVAKAGVGAARDAIGLADKITASGMTTRTAADFFGWGSGPEIAKPLTDFTRESLEAAGWTQENLSAVANAYRDIAKLTPNNVAAPARAQQLESLLNLFQ